jgi:hypothetical protein
MINWFLGLFADKSPQQPPPAWVPRELAVVDAMRDLAQWIRPGAPREVMEVATRLAFARVPGYSASYKDCVCIDARWRDLVLHFESTDAQWNPDAFGQSYPPS